MKITAKNITTGIAICVTLAFLLVFTLGSTIQETPSKKTVIQLDIITYSSIAELSNVQGLNAVVIGTVKGIAGHKIDYGTSNPIERTGKGIPSVLYEVNVTEVLLGVIDKNIIVSMIDTEAVIVPHYVTPFEIGQELLLFLKVKNIDNSSDIKSFANFYTPVSLDNGVFDILPDDLVSPRLESAFNLSSDKSGEPITFTLDEIREIISNDN